MPRSEECLALAASRAIAAGSKDPVTDTITNEANHAPIARALKLKLHDLGYHVRQWSYWDIPTPQIDVPHFFSALQVVSMSIDDEDEEALIKGTTMLFILEVQGQHHFQVFHVKFAEYKASPEKFETWYIKPSDTVRESHFLSDHIRTFPDHIPATLHRLLGLKPNSLS